MTSPTQRTLVECRRRGWIADVSERWIPNPKHPAGGQRKDLFGFVDIVAVGRVRGIGLGVETCSKCGGYYIGSVDPCVCGRQLIAIQATSGSNGASRVKKIREECGEALKALLAAGVIVEVWAWKKYAQAVDRKFWRPRITRVT